MTVKLVPYERNFGGGDGLTYIWKPVNPTGRWKLESGPGYVNRMSIEHKGLLFRRWIPEDWVDFLPEKTSKVFSCTKERPFKGLPRA